MKLKKIIFVRHGHYESSLQKNTDPPLSENGIMLANRLREKLKPVIEGLVTVCLSSSAKRCRETADIIVQPLNWVSEMYDLLWCDIGRLQDADHAAVLELIDYVQSETKCECIVVVTHLEYLGLLPLKFLNRKKLSTSLYSTNLVPDYSEAYVVDIENNASFKIDPFET